MTTITIDGTPYNTREGANLLEACLSLGFDLPYFCWHPALGSVGACRQCAVKQFRDEHDTRGRLVMACMTPVAEGTRISIEDPAAREFRTGVAEWLMVHHPHDCPVCDEGGECHLQDMTVMTGHTYRHYRGAKRTFRNQDLGPFVNQEMNRCIQCYRCVRFYRDYAGGRDFDAHFLRDRVFFGRHEDGVLESAFSGNLVEVCPTGVFTDKTLKRHYTRKWDERSAPSVCVHCAVGCNTLAGERYGMLRRIRNRFHGEVNGYFLCDRGRYGYEFVNSDVRVRRPLIRGQTELAERPVSEAIDLIVSRLATASRVIGIGSPRASLEANFALRTLVGPEHFFSGMAATEHCLVSLIVDVLRHGAVPAASLHDAEQSDAVFILGEDVTNTAPMLALALRRSVRQQPLERASALQIYEWDDTALRVFAQDANGPIFIATTSATHLDDVATATFRAAPDDVARLGFAVAHAIDPSAPDAAPSPDAALAKLIATTLRAARRPLIVSGTGSGHESVIHAAANLAWALQTAGRPVALALVVPECNSVGVSLLTDRSLDDACRVVERGGADVIVTLENDLYRRGAEQTIDRLFERSTHVITIDHLRTRTVERSDIVLPASTFADGDGTFVNYETRAQRAFQVFAPSEPVQESWRWIRALLAANGRLPAETWQDLDGITASLSSAERIFRPLLQVAPAADFRIAGLKIARESHRASGRTAITANLTVHEPRPPNDPDSALTFTMEGYQGQPPAPLITRFWSPGWNSIQSANFYQTEVGGPLRGGDPGIRLIEPLQEHPLYFNRVPPRFRSQENEWLCVPLHHIFGSEELSIFSPGVAELASPLYVAVGINDARRTDIADGEHVIVRFDDGTSHDLAARVLPALPDGVAGMPVGLTGLPYLPLPGRVQIVKVAPAVPRPNHHGTPEKGGTA
jgi:NADH-quinone oxidoreductase subunit G